LLNIIASWRGGKESRTRFNEMVQRKRIEIQYIELEVGAFNAAGVRFWKNREFSGYRLKMRKILK